MARALKCGRNLQRSPACAAQDGHASGSVEGSRRTAANAAARAALKDTVDARVLAWRGGKEGDIRALLCSLDAVLWDAVLDGVRVKDLHEVVSAAQVKRAYVKAVGRVHPDKV